MTNNGKPGRRKLRVDALHRRFYRWHVSPRDEYRQAVSQCVDATSIVLDLGAGRGNNRIADFRGQAARICGVDVDPNVLKNPYLDDARVIDQGRIPYDDDAFDVVHSLYVLEHLEDPRAVFAEVKRVLKPGGRFIALTPNKWHYVALIAKATPHWFHEYAVSKIHGREAHDTFPTFYRANSEGAIKRLARSLNLIPQEIRLKENAPDYLYFSMPTFLLGVAYERLVRNVNYLRHFRSNLLIVLTKPAAA